MSRILIVDDEESILKSLRRLLSLTPCTAGEVTYKLTVDICSSPKEALEKARHTAYDLVLSDFRMPAMNGVQFLKALREIQPDAARLILASAEIRKAGGEPQRFAPGDSWFVKQGTEVEWKILTPRFVKHYLANVETR